MLTIACSFVYDGCSWEVVQTHLARHRSDDSPHVGTGSAAWAHLYATTPSKREVVVDSLAQERIERFQHFARGEDRRGVVSERLRWWQDEGGSGDTYFEASAEVVVPASGTTKTTLEKCTSLYRKATINACQRDLEAIRSFRAAGTTPVDEHRPAAARNLAHRIPDPPAAISQPHEPATRNSTELIGNDAAARSLWRGLSLRHGPGRYAYVVGCTLAFCVIFDAAHAFLSRGREQCGGAPATACSS